MAQLIKTIRSNSERTKTSRTSPSYQDGIFGKKCDQEEYPVTPTNNNNKKSVLKKVKEKAQKLRHSLSCTKRHGATLSSINNNSSPSWGVTLAHDDDDKETVYYDPEFLEDPMYETEAAPGNSKETTRQHFKAVPVISTNVYAVLEKEKHGKILQAN